MKKPRCREALEFGGASGIRPHKRGPRFRLQAKPFESRRKQKLFCLLEAPMKKPRCREALEFGGASGIRTPDLWIMIPSL
jgi:hypothetical protein